MNMAELGRAAAWTWAAVLLVGAATGCAFFSPFSSCEGTGAALRALDADPVLQVRPPEAAPATGLDLAGGDCTDDSGDAWLSAERMYSHPGTPRQVLDHYRAVLPAQGWSLRGPDAVDDPVHPVRVLSFSHGSSGRELTLAFETPDTLVQWYDYRPGPETAGHTWYLLMVEEGV
ncbi:hypothetical protein [Streptomyces sp. NPDC090022]|uniref:hypothetical protein n=1 Tax=Streptomyces sp. NPDC090022 TaxID=3365920 RepID=UPI0038244533